MKITKLILNSPLNDLVNNSILKLLINHPNEFGKIDGGAAAEKERAG